MRLYGSTCSVQWHIAWPIKFINFVTVNFHCQPPTHRHCCDSRFGKFQGQIHGFSISGIWLHRQFGSQRQRLCHQGPMLHQCQRQRLCPSQPKFCSSLNPQQVLSQLAAAECSHQTMAMMTIIILLRIVDMPLLASHWEWSPQMKHVTLMQCRRSGFHCWLRFSRVLKSKTFRFRLCIQIYSILLCLLDGFLWN